MLLGVIIWERTSSSGSGSCQTLKQPPCDQITSYGPPRQLSVAEPTVPLVGGVEMAFEDLAAEYKKDRLVSYHLPSGSWLMGVCMNIRQLCVKH